MTGRHHAPQAPLCPHCGDLQEPTYAILCATPISHRVHTGYTCAKPDCVATARFLQAQHEDEVIAAAVRRGVINS